MNGQKSAANDGTNAFLAFMAVIVVLINGFWSVMHSNTKTGEAVREWYVTYLCQPNEASKWFAVVAFAIVMLLFLGAMTRPAKA